MIENLREEQYEYVARQRRKSNIRRAFFVGIAAVLFLLLILNSYNNKHFVVTHYSIESDKINNPIKIAHLSDLHSAEFGEDNVELIGAIQSEKPDIIIMTGDMVNDYDTDLSVLINLCRELIKVAPIYYVYGNHEFNMNYIIDEPIELSEILREDGVNVVGHPSPVDVEINGEVISLYGILLRVEHYDSWAGEKSDRIEEFWEGDQFKIVYTHYPEYFYETLKRKDFDLALAGHYHGGLIRIPFIGGLYHTDTGFFPQYSGGEYQLSGGQTLIVSRGLGGKSTTVPRINNPPELVMIDVE